MQVQQADQSTFKEEQHSVTAEIEAGAAEGTKLRFPRQGDQGIKKIPSKFILTTSENAHSDVAAKWTLCFRYVQRMWWWS